MPSAVRSPNIIQNQNSLIRTILISFTKTRQEGRSIVTKKFPTGRLIKFWSRLRSYPPQPEMIYLFAKVGGEQGGPTVVRTLLLILSPPAPPLPARIKVSARLPKVFVVGHYTKQAEGRLQVARVILPIKIKCAEDFILLGIVHICFFGAESLALATKK